MPREYTILPQPLYVVQLNMARRKVPIECREAIEKIMQERVDQQIITPSHWA